MVNVQRVVECEHLKFVSSSELVSGTQGRHQPYQLAQNK